MFELVRKVTRASTDIEFFSLRACPNISSEALDYFVEKYIKTGKRISDTRTLSEDGLTATIVELWDSRESYLEYLCDPFIDDHLTSHTKEYLKNHDIEYKIISAEEK